MVFVHLLLLALLISGHRQDARRRSVLSRPEQPLKAAPGSFARRSSRLGTHSNPCDHDGCEGETREIVLRMAVISGCDASPVLELAEHSFDEISAFVGPAVQRIGRPA